MRLTGEIATRLHWRGTMLVGIFTRARTWERVRSGELFLDPKAGAFTRVDVPDDAQRSSAAFSFSGSRLLVLGGTIPPAQTNPWSPHREGAARSDGWMYTPR